MMAELWLDIDQDMQVASRHLRNAIEMLRTDRFGSGDPGDDTDEVAFKYRIQIGYTAFESALKRLLALLDEEVPGGSRSHADLPRRFRSPIPGGRPALLDEGLYRAADQSRRFRHVAVHAYDDLDLDRAALLVRDAETFLAGIGPALARFRAAIDPDWCHRDALRRWRDPRRTPGLPKGVAGRARPDRPVRARTSTVGGDRGSLGAGRRTSA